MTPRQLRQAQRAVHLAMAVLVAAAVYLPLPGVLPILARAIAIPALALSGIAMWQAARLRRLRRRLGRQRPTVPQQRELVREGSIR